MPMLVALPLNDSGSEAHPYLLPDTALIIGRSKDCGLQLDHISISRQHAKIYRIDGVWHIDDMHSRNGTYRNGQRFESEELREGDIVHIGDWALVFSENSPENLVAMSSWLERVKQKATDLSVRIYVAHNDQSVGAPVSAVAPPAVKPLTPGKVVRAKPSDILKSAAYQGTATLPTLQKPGQNGPGLKFISKPPLPANHTANQNR